MKIQLNKNIRKRYFFNMLLYGSKMLIRGCNVKTLLFLVYSFKLNTDFIIR